MNQSVSYNHLCATLETVQQQIANLVELPQLSQKERDYIYNFAAISCQIGDFNKAIPLFQFLVLLDQSENLYLKGLAGALHGAKRFKDALELYKLAYQMQMEHSYDCLFYGADCLINLNDKAGARDYLLAFIAASEQAQVAVDQIMFKRAKLLLDGAN